MITKQIAGILYGYGYRLQDNEGNVWDINSALDTGFGLVRVGKTGGYIRIYASFWQIGSTYKILAREMDLTKPIEGVGVPIVELAKIVIPSGSWALKKYAAINIEGAKSNDMFFRHISGVDFSLQENEDIGF